LTVKVNALLETTKKDAAEQMYEIVSETFAEKF
ncbi:MAG: RNA-binding S4 domain-containing protein, partial [Loigolactobacillus coryniformis]|nr:RNA-binding S4 domain-containing protein [Loigolactobacillus coryniformis]